MATSIASQLQAIKSVLRGSDDPLRRPITRPSILFDAKEAADIDLRTILPLALSGLDALFELDPRFGRYKDTLFSHTSLEVDRESMVPKEEEKLNLSINSYLRLLSGHLHMQAALKTLEYLIRRYQVHVFNMDELILCALPYHDTHAFVRIVQLIDLGNKKWAFLEGVKTSGAPPPRKVIVQQCICDGGILETLSNYVSPTKVFQHSRPVVCFCTVVIVEALGGIPRLDTATVNRVQNFVFDGLNPAMSGNRDHKAGALMVIGLLATRATLKPKLVQSLISSIGRVAQQDANESADLPLLRVAVMAMVSLVQSQSVQMLPKKTTLMLKDIRDFAGILSGLSLEFNIQKFLRLYLEALVEYSATDESLHLTLSKTMENIPSKDLVENIVSKVLDCCARLSQGTSSSNSDVVVWGKRILGAISKHYSLELQEAVCRYLENSLKNSKEENPVFQNLCHMFNSLLSLSKDASDSKLSKDISYSKIWFSLEHPKALVRLTTLSDIATSGNLKDIAANSQKLMNIEDSIVRRLHDHELSVVQAALSIEELAETIDPSHLFKAYHDILSRCIHCIEKRSSKSSLATDVALTCLNRMVLDFGSHVDYSKEIARILFPFLLVLPKTWKVNLKAIELVKQTEWPFYQNIATGCDTIYCEQIKVVEPGSSKKKKSWNADYIISVNMKTIGLLAKTFLTNPHEHVQWLIECGNTSKLSKSLFLLIMLHAWMIHNEEKGSFFKLHQACFPVLMHEWHLMESQGISLSSKVPIVMHEWHEVESQGISIPPEERNMEKLNKFYIGVSDQLFSSDVDAMNLKTMICIFCSLLQAYAEAVNQNSLEYSNNQILDDLFCFFANMSSRNAFRKHLHFLIAKCTRDAFQFLSKYFTNEGFSEGVQLESLISVAAVCSMYTSADIGSMNENGCLQILVGFPSLLIPLFSTKKDVRATAISCIEGLYKLWGSYVDVFRLKNGNDSTLFRSVTTPVFGDFLNSIISQEKLIISDANFLSSFLPSLLSPSTDTLCMPKKIGERFDKPAKDAILLFILSSALQFSSYGKLMVLSLLKGVGGAILQIEEVKLLLFELLERQNRNHIGLDMEHENLSDVEVEILCLLLEIGVSKESSEQYDADVISCLIKSLKVYRLSSENQTVVRPCVTVLQNMSSSFYNCLKTEMQDDFFGHLVFLFRSDNGKIRTAAREALLRIDVNPSTIGQLFEVILDQDRKIASAKRMKKKNSLSHQSFGLSQDSFNDFGTIISLLSSLLDILLLKKDITARSLLIKPLLKVLEKLFSDEWLQSLIGEHEKGNEASTELSDQTIGALSHAQQTTLLILKDFYDSVLSDPLSKDDVCSKSDIDLLLSCARSVKDAVTTNHVFLLLSSVAKVSSGWLSEHIIDIFILIGESAVKQGDSHSQSVLEELITTLVPCWLSKTNSIEKLLQIFITTLPDIAEQRRLTIMVYLLRTIGEKDSLPILLIQLFRSLVQRQNKSSPDNRKPENELSCSDMDSVWEYLFAQQICDQYSCKTWLPCLVKLVEEINMYTECEEQLGVLHLSIKFILQKLQDTELVFELDSGRDSDYIQVTFGALMEQVVLHLQLVHVGSKKQSITADAIKELKECAHVVLRTITEWMVPSSFFSCITQLLRCPTDKVKTKALKLLCESLMDSGLVQKSYTEVKRKQIKQRSTALQIDDNSKPYFHEMCLKILNLINGTEENTEIPVKLTAISSIEVLAKAFPTVDMIFGTCLECIVKYISSPNFAISSGCLRTTGSLITVLGSKSLSQFPNLMKNMLERAREVSTTPLGKFKQDHQMIAEELPSSKISIITSILIVLEAVVENLGGFLNPYLDDVLDILVLRQEYSLESDQKINSRGAAIRKLLTEKIPVRLLLPTLLRIYDNALKCGELSLSLSFEMLASLISSLDKLSTASYHAKIYQHCLIALDLRREHPQSIKNVDVVEQNVIHAIIILTMKTTETMFRPLFLHSLEWAESEVDGSESRKIRSIDRSISFYKLVNKLIEHHRSLFVPYFKYLLEGCTHYLTGDSDANSSALAQKRKKAKVGGTKVNGSHNATLPPSLWHLRALILKSLHKCFLYDTLDLKFLDSSNFQVLVKPIVSQFVVEPPAYSELSSDAPTVEEVDELIVSCLGQMAVTSHSDVLWQPLNHEVLMQTRNEKVRPRILGLRVVKYLLEHLKEEYLSLMAQTVPFLAELLEDVELPVKTLAQEILREMETISGENIRQYL